MEQAFNIFDLRKSMGMTQSEFALAIGLTTKSKVSEIEKYGKASVDVSLAIENLSILNGVARIDAATLNDDVKKARGACVAVCHSSDEPEVCQGGDASASAADSASAGDCASQGDGSDHAASFTPRPAPLSTGNAREISRHSEGVVA